MTETPSSTGEVDRARVRKIVALWRDVGMDGWFRVDPAFDRSLADMFMVEDELER